jgi:hypothetical protein
MAVKRTIYLFLTILLVGTYPAVFALAGPTP